MPSAKQTAARKKFKQKVNEAKALSKKTGKKYTTCMKEVWKKK